MDATSAAVLDAVANQLKIAPHRKGGAGKGCRLPSTVTDGQDSPAASVSVGDNSISNDSDSPNNTDTEPDVH